MGILDWFKPVNKAIDVIDKYVEDKDEKNRLIADLDKLAHQAYMKELDTSTIPWVDALHKMSRPLLGALNVLAPCILLGIHPDMDINKLLTAIGGGAGVSGLYTLIKGKGK